MQMRKTPPRWVGYWRVSGITSPRPAISRGSKKNAMEGNTPKKTRSGVGPEGLVGIHRRRVSRLCEFCISPFCVAIYSFPFYHTREINAAKKKKQKKDQRIGAIFVRTQQPMKACKPLISHKNWKRRRQTRRPESVNFGASILKHIFPNSNKRIRELANPWLPR